MKESKRCQNAADTSKMPDDDDDAVVSAHKRPFGLASLRQVFESA